jgi:hypothetical protein
MVLVTPYSPALGSKVQKIIHLKLRLQEKNHKRDNTEIILQRNTEKVKLFSKNNYSTQKNLEI